MTDNEINRKFDVVAGHLATLAVGMQQLQEAQVNAERNMQELRETQTRAEKRWERTEEGIRSLLAIAGIHEQEITELRDLGKATDERLNVLIGVVEKHISGGNGQHP